MAAALWTASPVTAQADSSNYENQVTIYRYLTETMGVSSAGACGIMANIDQESSFDPHSYYQNSYGICQWHNARFDSLKNYCLQRGLDYTTLPAQLEYLNYELSTSYARCTGMIRAAENSAEGAYQAGWTFCYYFERPANTATRSIARGNLARNTYWVNFGGKTFGTPANSIEPAKAANVVLARGFLHGNYYKFSGQIQSESPIQKVTVTVKRLSGASMMSASITPNTGNCSLSDLTYRLNSNTLPAGAYLFQIDVTNAAGTTRLVNQSVNVFSKSRVFPSANVKMEEASGSRLAVSSGSGREPVLAVSSSSKKEAFQVIYIRNGRYAIRSMKTGNYLTFTKSGKLCLSAWKGLAAQYWYILPVEGNGYRIISRTNLKYALTVTQDIAGARLTCTNQGLSAAQVFRITKNSSVRTAVRKPVLSGKVKMSVAKTKLKVKVGGKAMIQAKSSGSITYLSSASGIVRVSKKGVVKGIRRGSAAIYVTARKYGCNPRTARVLVKVA